MCITLILQGRHGSIFLFRKLNSERIHFSSERGQQQLPHSLFFIPMLYYFTRNSLKQHTQAFCVQRNMPGEFTSCDWPHFCCVLTHGLCRPPYSSEWPSSPPPPPSASSLSGPAAGYCERGRRDGRQRPTERCGDLALCICMEGLLTPWPDCVAPHSPLPASGCRPPCPPPPASASWPPPGAFGCSIEGQQHSTPALMSHWGE